MSDPERDPTQGPWGITFENSDYDGTHRAASWSQADKDAFPKLSIEQLTVLASFPGYTPTSILAGYAESEAKQRAKV